ncbi:hypothetical protein WJS89_03355 [Sphingomicrobium sp. XHP0235]|uniref:hypothetical protein n=1 Tax=Sphingomicrobium aquimarinum TaxID=3133971 RepID=UPI0031FEFC17
MDMQHRFTPATRPAADLPDDERPFPRRAEETRSLVAIAHGRAFAASRPQSSLSADEWPVRKDARAAMMTQRHADRRFARWEAGREAAIGSRMDEQQGSAGSRIVIALAGLLTGVGLAQALDTGVTAIGAMLGF